MATADRFKRTAFIAGGSGLIGGFLLDELIDSAFHRRVIAMVRKPLEKQSERLLQLAVDFRNLDAVPESARELLRGADLFCALGTTIKKAGSKSAFRSVDLEAVLAFADWGKKRGASRFFVVTALGADPRSAFLYNRVKGEAEEELKRRGFNELHVFRPSLLLGPRAETRAGERVAEKAFGALSFLARGRIRNYFPIDAADVARAMRLAAAEMSEEHRPVRIYEPLEMLRLIRRRSAPGDTLQQAP